MNEQSHETGGSSSHTAPCKLWSAAVHCHKQHIDRCQWHAPGLTGRMDRLLIIEQAHECHNETQNPKANTQVIKTHNTVDMQLFGNVGAKKAR